MAAAKTMSGFSLMEVLITLVILSIGLLGLAGMQYDAIRSNQTAYYGALAVVMANDAADRIRASSNNTGGPCPLTGNGGNCDASHAALQFNGASWSALVAARIPGGEGVICLDSSPEDGTAAGTAGCDGAQTGGINSYAVKVWWDEDRDPNTDMNRFVMSVVP